MFALLLLTFFSNIVNSTQYDNDFLYEDEFPYLDATKFSLYEDDREGAECICNHLNEIRDILIEDTHNIKGQGLEVCLGEVIIYALSNPTKWLGKNESNKKNNLSSYFNVIFTNVDSTDYLDMETLEDHINRGVYVLLRSKTWKKKKNKEKMRRIRKRAKNLFGDHLQDMFTDQITQVIFSYLKRRTLRNDNTDFIFKILNRKKENLSIFDLNKKLSPWKRNIRNFLEKYQAIEGEELDDNFIAKKAMLQSLSHVPRANKYNKRRSAGQVPMVLRQLQKRGTDKDIQPFTFLTN